MNDITERLAGLAASGEPASAPAPTVADDLARGRAARRRRTRWAATGVLGVAALGAAAGVLVSGAGTGSPTARHLPAGTIRLVDYTGPQQAGFVVTKVPDGYVLQGASPSVLDVTKPGDTSSIDSFVGKLVVSLQSSDATTDHAGTPVTVNGHPGTIRDGDGATTLEFTDGTHDIVVQEWNDIHLTDQQLVTFADGITVTSAAQTPVG